MAKTADERPVHTDALQTLGTIIGPGEKRDAIHLAVEPVVAGEDLHPGDDVGRLADGTFGIAGKPLGIVDPFLSAPVGKGQRFWLIIYPRQITSLNHVWEHPDFPAAGYDVGRVRRVTERLTRASETWIRDEFVPKVEDYGHELTYAEVMEGARRHLEGGEGVCAGNDIDYDFIGQNIDKFWEHFVNVTGIEVPAEKRESFFRCAC